MSELRLVPKSCKGTSLRNSSHASGMIQHRGQDSMAKLLASCIQWVLEVSNVSKSVPFVHVIPIPKDFGVHTDLSSCRRVAFNECLSKAVE